MSRKLDVVIIGSGFGGSLLSMILARAGMEVAIIDKARHPRFAIGESSTPTADAMIERLSRQWDLPELAPLATYGSWRKAYGDVTCGRKRGFSYFGHTVDDTPSSDQQLLVMASRTDNEADTHWLRSEVDELFFKLAAWRNVLQLQNARYQVTDETDAWTVSGTSLAGTFSLRCDFVVDASGPMGEIMRLVGAADATHRLKTNSSAIYGHFENVRPFQSVMENFGFSTAIHPFPCDAAALHHVLDNGWMWQLRFDDQSVSAGFAFHNSQGDESQHAEARWHRQLRRFPMLWKQFEGSRILEQRTPLRCLPRMQRLWASAAGERWGALPSATGFVDPLHSTGIAHTLSGVSRLADVLLASSDHRERSSRLAAYSDQIVDELCWIDMLVEGCYASLPNFRLWSAWCMLYFAAATSTEHGRGVTESTFLQAANGQFRSVAKIARTSLQQAIDEGSTEAACERFEGQLRELIAPYNDVGLLDNLAGGMYTQTAKTFVNATSN
ncbi:MAG: tryptophan 7-halogenase [Pirellulaceae bacterium]